MSTQRQQRPTVIDALYLAELLRGALRVGIPADIRAAAIDLLVKSNRLVWAHHGLDIASKPGTTLDRPEICGPELRTQVRELVNQVASLLSPLLMLLERRPDDYWNNMTCAERIVFAESLDRVVWRKHDVIEGFGRPSAESVERLVDYLFAEARLVVEPKSARGGDVVKRPKANVRTRVAMALQRPENLGLSVQAFATAAGVSRSAMYRKDNLKLLKQAQDHARRDSRPMRQSQRDTE